ncbi:MULTISPECIES: hypothetical protein [unclassified Prochlorococcus]|uniref:hypothetical protein n=1 Tax=unclassified Prochlorococcus TaxID=2627481 RepID=UPI00053379DC|nr:MULTISPECIES: hypothetical protein [unclassified Prochlorococcus]KGG16741.1 cyanobacterial hypothetical protein [Prochlorococcus sp. MIT 0602]KGG18286.1 cyanobacterial hypothetical protein [Prochlorococcus sp. MIT 0603]
MQKTLKSIFSLGLFILLTFVPCGLLQAAEIEILSERLQNSLNTNKKRELFTFLSEEIAKDIVEEYDQFIKNFPNAKWEIKPIKKKGSNQNFIKIIVSGDKEKGDHKYSLMSQKEIVVIEDSGKIVSKKILSDYSILKTGKNLLNVNINIPDAVLTGSKYDIDIILEKPLGSSIIAGGIISLTQKSKAKNNNQAIELIPMGSGGIFKSTRAPIKAGEQRWGALLAHPEGLISITKMVRVVSDPKELLPQIIYP